MIIIKNNNDNDNNNNNNNKYYALIKPNRSSKTGFLKYISHMRLLFCNILFIFLCVRVPC